MRKIWLGAVLCAALGVATSAKADTFNLTSDHCTDGCGPQTGGFGNVTVTQSAANTLAFSLNVINGNQIINTGFPLSFGFDLVGNPNITYSGLTSGFSIPDVKTGNVQSADAYHMDGFGDMEYGVLWGQQGGGHGTAGPLTFSITATGLTLASLEQNAGGAFFVADIISGTNGNTGLVDGSTRANAVPGPVAGAGIPGLISAFGVMMIALNRRRKQRAGQHLAA